MGAEREAILDDTKTTNRVRALLETDELIFRAAPASKNFTTLVVKFSEIATLVVADGVLIFTTKHALRDPRRAKKEKYALHLGEPFASRWLEKIKNPKGIFEKLGIKSGSNVAFIGDVLGAAPDFAKELRARSEVNVTAVSLAPERGAQAVAAKSKSPQKQADLYLLFIKSKVELAAISALAKVATKGGAAIWIVYPKGQRDPRELDVISAGRAAGLKDVKVARFSDTHTALKFVAPKT